MTAFAQWLRETGLDRYAKILRDNDIDFSNIKALTEVELKELGLTLGHRKNLLAAIAALNSSAAKASDATKPATATITSVVGSDSGERRQLTVLFCDLVGFTQLASRVDPEVLQEVIRAYEDACAACVTRYEGYVFQRLGDGVVAFFGYPLAHEGEAERAIHAGLAILDAMSTLRVADMERLQVRIGIATGLVVVSSLEKGAVGETMNLAARLQSIAPTGGLLVSERVRQLAGGGFVYEDMGAQQLKGISTAVSAFRVQGVSRLSSRFDAATQAVLTPMMGRDHELALLMGRWQQVQDGEGQVVLLSGEPGIGKSRILSAFMAQLSPQGWSRTHSPRALLFQCSPYYTNNAFFPSIDHLERALSFERDETAESKLDKLEALVITHYGRPQSDVRFLGAMLSLPTEARYGPIQMTPQRIKDEILRAMVDLVEAAARQQPSVLLFEDAHWSDPTSLEFLDLLIDRVKEFPLLILITHRLEFHNRWTSQGHVSALNLSKLTRAQSAAMAAMLAKGKALPGNLQDQIIARTDGVPLFVEELTKAILESDQIAEKEDRYEYRGDPSQLIIPATLRDSLMARLDRHQVVKEVAQMGAVIGREFSYELIQAIAPQRIGDLDQALQQLTESGLAFRRGTPPEAIYTFKHALVQDAAYDSLLKSRRREVHAQIADVLLRQFPLEAALRPSTIAQHMTKAESLEEALIYWIKAGKLALQQSANLEAIMYLNSGLKIIERIPRTSAISRHELEINLSLWPAYMATKGFSTPEVEKAALRARELCEHFGDMQGVALAMIGKFAVHLVRAELDSAQREVREGLGLVRKLESPQLAALMKVLIADVYHWQGQFMDSRHFLNEALIPWNLPRAKELAEQTGLDAHCIGLAYRGLNESIMGYADQGRLAISEAIEGAETLGNAQTMGHCLGLLGWLAVFMRDVNQARHWAAKTIEYCGEQRLVFWEASGYLVDGWVLVQEGRYEDGVRRVHQGIEIRRSAGAALVHASFYAVLAECHCQAGRYENSLEMISEGLAHIEQTGERHAEAELYRVRGEVVLARDTDYQRAAEDLHKAMQVAQNQGAKTYQLRAAVSLTRLFQSQGKHHKARDLLTPLYEWFVEGFDTKDLKDARALLDELA